MERSLCTLLILGMIASMDPLQAQLTGWTPEPDYPHFPREGTCSFVLGDSAYVVGGANLLMGNNVHYGHVWRYDPNTLTWAQRSSTPAQVYAGIGFALNGYGYVVRGYQTPRRLYRYDALADSWTNMGPLPGSSEFLGHAVVLDTMAYLINTWSGSMYAYAPTANTWTQVTAPSGILVIAAFGVNGTMYAVNNAGQTYAYDPLLDMWTQKATVPVVGTSDWRSFTIYGQAYMTCGLDLGTGVINTVYRYDPWADAWSTTLTFPGTPAILGSSFTVNDRGYLCGGAFFDPITMATGYITEMWSTGAVGSVSMDEGTGPGAFQLGWDAWSRTFSALAHDGGPFDFRLLDALGRTILDGRCVGDRLQVALDQEDRGLLFFDVRSSSGGRQVLRAIAW